MNEKKNNPDLLVPMKQNWGPYRLTGTVEYGRFSKAYLGEDIEYPAKQFVVEIFPLTLTANEGAAFLQSGRSLTRLVHPSILRLVDVGIENARPFIVLDSIPHVSFRRMYVRGQGQPFEKLLPYLRQMASALQHAHTQGHIHRHLCPDNVLLTSNNTVLLCDFAIDGLDKNALFQSYQRGKLPIEPLVYMAPEQIQQQPVNASDQYALAIMIYEWLCGTPPFLGNPAIIAQQQLANAPLSMRQQVPNISPNVEAVIMMALAKEPAKRFANVAAFMHALEQAYGPTQPRDAREPALHADKRVTPPYLVRLPTEPLPPVSSPITPPPPTIQPKPVIAGNNPIDVSANLANARRSPTPRSLQPPAPSIPPQAQQKSKNSTRRAILISAASVAVAGGIGSWLLWNRLHPITPAYGNGGNNTTPTTVPSGQSVVYSAHTARVNAVAWSPDGQKVASASDDKRVLICDRTGKTLLTYSGHQDHVNTVAWSPNGQYIASGSADKTVQIWDATSGQLAFTYNGHTDVVNAVAWSADNRFVASGSDDKTVRAWFADPAKATIGELFLIYKSSVGHTKGVTSVAWSPDGNKIASGSWDNTLQVCAAFQNDAFAVGDRIFSARIHGDNPIYAIAWSPDGTLIASGGGDNLVQICDGTTGNTDTVGYHSPNIPRHDQAVRSVTWSPDGKFLASGGDDKVARVWDATTGKPTHIFANHSNAVLALDWSPDGTLVASGSADATVQLWKPS